MTDEDDVNDIGYTFDYLYKWNKAFLSPPSTLSDLIKIEPINSKDCGRSNQNKVESNKSNNKIIKKQL